MVHFDYFQFFLKGKAPWVILYSCSVGFCESVTLNNIET